MGHPAGMKMYIRKREAKACESAQELDDGYGLVY